MNPNKLPLFSQYNLPTPEGAPISNDAQISSLYGIEQDNSVISNGGSLQSSNYIPNVSGWYLDSTTGDFNFAINVDSLNIPDTTTANSFHTDSSGNSWWGANVATGYAGANAYILATGAAVFKNIKVGGASIQYQVTNAGIFSFGDGSDGAATLDGSATPAGMTKSGSDYTMTRDVYYTDMTMSTGTTLNPAGYRIFGTGTLTMNGTAIIKRNGNNGSNGNNASTPGTGATGGSGGAALADGYLKGSVAGGTGATGGAGGSGAGVAGSAATGTNTQNSIGSNGVAGGSGGAGGSGFNGGGQAGGSSTGGTATQSNVKLIANWHLATLLDVSSSGSTVKFDNSAGAAGGGGGGGGSGDNLASSADGGSGGGGGGGGSSGGIIAIYFRNIIIGASASITANGGTGGNGGNGLNAVNVSGGDAGGGGGGGGGAGGNGGEIILVYNVLTNSGTLTAAGGAGGTGGTPGSGTGTGTSGVSGSTGTTGAAGHVRQFEISM